MLKTYVTSVVLVIALGLTTITSARYLQDTDDRDKRQIGDLRTAEYLARITLDKNKLLRYLQMPSHCADIACGLVDVFESGKRKKRSLDSVFNGLSDEQKYRLSNILLSSARDDQYS
ncbi:uncharacterized protein LOC132717613 isoform X2 [Ruditapes philippinarum]|uniref:uncharacterized protein LOC132717613 isoform X2 n=1 Tax=Ruditapes philippinarum TaxID=129788 RepID=UPI00295B633A|nr:uncharacterized protein LOC132717613 isoform X2 [Ruditapes philippinarum]